MVGPEEHCDQLEHEGEVLAKLADGVGEDRGRTVVTCPEWDLVELFRHVGGLYRWSAWLVGHGIGAETWRSALPIEYPERADDWGAWLREGLDAALAAFRTTDPAARVWAWGGDQHARFWPRRMLFETVVHRCDAELTLRNRTSPFAEAVAVDGIDEFLELLPYVGRWNPAIAHLRDEKKWSIGLATTDTDDHWRVRVGPTGFWSDRSDAATDARVVATANDLLLWLQGRPAGIVGVNGDQAVVDRWTDATTF
jgi:uncharacterized protein (TIGR03083 family)